MRKLIVSNFVTLDGLYEGKDKISTRYLIIKSLSDVNADVLKKIFAKAFEKAQQ